MPDLKTGRRLLLKRFTRLGAAGLFASPFLTACSSKKASSETGQATIKMGVTGRPRMLDPRKATDALSSRINRLIYQSLIDFDDSFQPVPSLAKWEKQSENTYLFTLVNPATFHHGKPLTAEDVVATYRSILDPSFGSAHFGSLKHIQRVTALSAHQVLFELKHPDALFVGRLTIGICPADLIAQNYRFQDHPIGSGAARFVSMDEQSLTLRRQKDGVPLQFIPVKDATVRVLKLRKGELDLIQNDLSPEMVGYCEDRKDLEVSWRGGTNFNYIGFNFEDPILAVPEIRQAIAYGINRPAIIKAMFRGHARLAGGLLAPNHWAGNPELHGYPYNPQKAQQLLKVGLQKLAKTQKNARIPSPASEKQADLEAGLGILEKFADFSEEKTHWPPVLLELSYKTSSDPTRLRLAAIYQSQLRRIGIQLKIQSYDWGTFYNDIKQGRFQLYSLAWVGIKSPDIFKYVFDSSAIPPNGANRGRYRDEVADRLIREAEKETDLEKAAMLYRQLQAHLQRTLACLPLWYEDQYAVHRVGIQGYTLYADGRYDGLLTTVKG
jgi:peptide/nickel transport system substrate-binding protein